MKLKHKLGIGLLAAFITLSCLYCITHALTVANATGKKEIRDSLATAAMHAEHTPIPRPQWTTVRLCEERIVKVPVSGLEPERFNAQKLSVCRDTIVLTSDFNGALP